MSREIQEGTSVNKNKFHEKKVKLRVLRKLKHGCEK